MEVITSKPRYELFISGTYELEGVPLRIERSKFIDCTNDKHAIKYAESVGDLIVDKLQDSGACKIDITFRLVTTYQIHQFKECYLNDI